MLAQYDKLNRLSRETANEKRKQQDDIQQCWIRINASIHAHPCVRTMIVHLINSIRASSMNYQIQIALLYLIGH